MNQTENNVYDRLLYYLSHEGELRWEKFKDSVDKLTGDQQRFEYASTYLKSIARLGHFDYDPLNLSVIAIAPAALVETAVENRYVLVGSRTPDFIEEIKKCVSDTGGKLCKKLDRYSPITIVLSDLTEVSFTEIESMGIHISHAFSAKLSKILPTPKHTGFPQDNTILPDLLNKFDFKTSKFEPYNQRQRRNGLYEIPRYGPSIYVLKSGSDQRKIPRDWGIWLTLFTAGRTRGLISYVKKSRTWCVNYPVPLPLIVDRCATLCSGFPPKSKNSFNHYSDVPIGVAYQLTKSIHQNWEIV